MMKLVTNEMLLAAGGKEIGGQSEYWIYLANLKAYQEGVLAGVYLHFPFTRKELNEAFEMIFVGSDFMNTAGSTYEDYFILDYNAPFVIGKYEYLPNLIEKYELLNGRMNHPH